jgi:antitoxin ParD1/3/4
MPSSINLSLTDELRAFIDEQSGDGTSYATPSEFLRDVLREKKRRIEAAALRDAVIEGFRDVIDGRFVEFDGSLKDCIAEAKRRDKEGW